MFGLCGRGQGPQGSGLLIRPTPHPPPACPPLKQPNVASITKKFSYKLVKTGSVVLSARTDLRGYVAGQVLRLQADIENQSGKSTGPVMASLLQVRVLTSWGGGWPACPGSQAGPSPESVL